MEKPIIKFIVDTKTLPNLKPNISNDKVYEVIELDISHQYAYFVDDVMKVNMLQFHHIKIVKVGDTNYGGFEDNNTISNGQSKHEGVDTGTTTKGSKNKSTTIIS
jgi:hypothetical protein